MQVRHGFTTPATIRRLVLAIPLAMALTFMVHTAPASAITRDQVLKRANNWVVKQVPYSQRGSFQGYRRDCSGFVSMAWKLKTSYTSRSIGAVARRIPKSKLRPGDAVSTVGHVAVFGGWANKAKTRYWALEQSGRGKTALKRARAWRTGAKALRYRGIREKPQVANVAHATIPVSHVDTVVRKTAVTPLPFSAPFRALI